MEKTKKKLQLHKDTLRNLSDDSLSQVAGGLVNVVSVLCASGICHSVVCDIEISAVIGGGGFCNEHSDSC